MAQYKGPPEMEPLLLDGDDYFSILFPTTVQAPQVIQGNSWCIIVQRWSRLLLFVILFDVASAFWPNIPRYAILITEEIPGRIIVQVVRNLGTAAHV